MKRLDSQCNRILRYLQSGKTLTPLDGLRRFGTLRLGARVYELKRAGHPIQSKLVKRGSAHVAEYSLRKRAA